MRINVRVVVVLLVLVGCGETQGVARTLEALTAVAPSVIDIGISNQGLEHNGIGATRCTDPTTGGTLSARRVTTNTGQTTVALTSSLETVSVVVEAFAEGVAGGSLELEFMSPAQ